MLTKDLLRYDIRQGVIRPRYVDAESRLWLSLAEELIHLYEAGIGQSLDDLEEETRPLINASRSPLIARGLNKLLMDRCRFRQPGQEHLARRLAVLESAAGRLAQPDMDSLEQFRATVARDLGEDPDLLARQLYDDLPFRQPLEAFDSRSPTWLLHRYNLAQAQGLLLFATELEVTLADANPGHRRILFRYLRFFQLLATMRQADGPEVRLTVDGPLSVLQQTKRYGLQLANLLPVLCGMSAWRLEAMIHLGATARLLLSHEDGLRTHYTRLTTYRPEGIATLAREMAAKNGDWTLLEDSPILNLGGQALVMPDMTFRHRTGQVVHLELFHAWHAGPLVKRLARLDGEAADISLVLGVERSLSRDPLVKSQLDNSPWFQKHGFLYLEFPLVNRLSSCLNSFLYHGH